MAEGNVFYDSSELDEKHNFTHRQSPVVIIIMSLLFELHDTSGM